MEDLPPIKRGRGRPRKYPRAEDIAREAEIARRMAGPTVIKRVPRDTEAAAAAEKAEENKAAGIGAAEENLQNLNAGTGTVQNSSVPELSPEAQKIAAELFRDLDEIRTEPEAQPAAGNAAEADPEQPVKRKRGRPRKNPEDLAVNRRQREKEKNMVVVKVPTYEAMYGNTEPLYTRPDTSFVDAQNAPQPEEPEAAEPAANVPLYRSNLSNRPQNQIRTSSSTGPNAPSPAAGAASDIIRNTDLARQADQQRNMRNSFRNSWPVPNYQPNPQTSRQPGAAAGAGEGTKEPYQSASSEVRDSGSAAAKTVNASGETGSAHTIPEKFITRPYGTAVAQPKTQSEINCTDRSKPSEFKGPGIRMGKVVEIGSSKLIFYYVVFKNLSHDDPIFPDTLHTLQHLMSLAAQQCGLKNVVKVLPCGSRTAFEVAVIDPPQDFPVSDLRRLMIMAGYIKTLPQEELNRCSCPDYMNLDDAHRELQNFVETVYGVTIGGYSDNREL